MNLATRLAFCTFFVMASLTVSGTPAAEPTVLTIYAAGTLAVPFKEINALFEKQNPGVTVQAQFGGSVMMAKRITELHHAASSEIHRLADQY